MDFKFSEGSLSASSDGNFTSIEMHVSGSVMSREDDHIEVRTHYDARGVPFHVVEFQVGKETLRVFLDTPALARLSGRAGMTLRVVGKAQVSEPKAEVKPSGLRHHGE